jgi:Nitroreductase
MNETLRAIEERFSCRAFTDEQPTDAQLEAITLAALQSPSAMNRQGWQIIVVRDKVLIDNIEAEGMKNLEADNQEMFQRMQERKARIFYNAPCVIIIAIKKGESSSDGLVDLGIVAQTAVITATSLGLASLHCGLAGLAFTGDKATEFKKQLGFPEGYEFGLSVLLGQAKEQGTPHPVDMSKVTYIK